MSRPTEENRRETIILRADEPGRRTERTDADRLAGLLAQVFDGEPPVADGVAAVFRRAEAIRRRRLRHLVSAGAAVALVVAVVGYVLTSAVLPTTPKRTSAGAAATPAPARDPVLDVLTAVTADRELRVVPRPPAEGEGWRQFAVSSETGRPRGLIQISVYAAPDGLCFPVRADPEVCARPDRSGDVEYVRYADEKDEDWQVTQTVARRVPDGRVVVVMATGQRGTGDSDAGRPPLTGREAAEVAVQARVMNAFGPEESCNGPDPACPLLRVPLPELSAE
ncbi:hypothetical protein [Jidongwangia harbinensis]|uniref:hypothetical protein n=1 Tax=Jidongwangia harbinensis TaxID=2878561 RepID=UPI001CDA334F|nr:hypothetical protein [Jidongwangia harbinensis]MCA2218487.1 hypothetical protein [Jidongwangia harbinensis]